MRDELVDGYGIGPLENPGPLDPSTAILAVCLWRRNALPPGHHEIRKRWTRRTIIAEAFELEARFQPPQSAGSEEP